MSKLRVWLWVVWQMLFGWRSWSLINNVTNLWRMDYDIIDGVYLRAMRAAHGRGEGAEWCTELSIENGDWFVIFYFTAPFIRILLRRACRKSDRWISKDQAGMAWGTITRRDS